MITTLLGLAGYLLYIAFMMGLAFLVFRASMSAFPILDEKKYESLLVWIVASLPFVLKDTLYLALIAGNLVRMATTSLLALIALSFFMGLSFLAVMGICSWVAILLPSATNSYPRLMFACIVGITFMVIKNMFELGTPVDDSVMVSASFSTLPSIFIRTKTTLVGLAIFINDYRIAYLVMRYATLLVLAFLPLVSNSMTTFAKYTKEAVIIT